MFGAKWMFFGSLVVLASVCAVSARGQVVLSEVMFDPSGSEFTDEFIEIRNVGDRAVDLAGWRVGDEEETDEVVPRGGGLLLPGGAFGLILDADYFDRSTRYDPLPEGALILTVGDATLGKGGLRNDGPERILLVAASGDTVAAVAYRAGNTPGHSEEKIDPAAGDGPENWADSRWEGGTPGRTNSVSPKEDDLALETASTSPFAVGAGERGAFALTVRNRGSRRAGAFRVEVSGEAAELAWETEGGDLAPGDSLRVAYPVPDLPPGRYACSAGVRFAADQDPTNDRVSFEILMGALPYQAVVNEVMFAPGAGEPEWVEILNLSGQPLDLCGWQIQDSRADAADIFQAASLRLPAGGYAVIAEDAVRFRSRYPEVTAAVMGPSRWPRLNDGGDAVVIRDATGARVDSVAYGGQAEPGRSLERIDPADESLRAENWLLSTDIAGATPGRSNSVAAGGETPRARLLASPNPFRDRVEIAYALPVSRADVNLQVFDRLGRRVRDLLMAEPGGSRRRVRWDGLGEGGRQLKPGIYILYLEAAAPDGRVYRARTSVVLARGL